MKQWLDRVTGRVTMYRLVLILLGVIAVVALALSAAGQLAYTVPQLVATLIVALGVSTASSWLFARLFRARAHLESSVITGLLLFFVLVPSSETGSLLILALAAALASLSKFVLAFRGRHIFNPAAIGAVLVTATGLGFSGWWVATLVLLPVVAIAAFIVLYRTRRLGLGLVFIVLAASIIVARMVSTGSDLGSAIVTAFTSYPIVFLAGFMLSEPLTLPPRRWQQLGLAALVAVLFAVPFSVGPVYSSPQLALVIGNLVAFFFGQRRAIRLGLLEKRQLTPTTWEFAFQPASRVRFRPGQYMELTLPHSRSDRRGSRRVFSISSAPTAEGPVTFAIKFGEKGSSFKRALLELPIGESVRATSVGGDFALPKDAAAPVLLVAGGIGITPFSSQLEHARQTGPARDVVVVYSVSDNAELAYADVLESSGARVVLVSPDRPASLPESWTWAGSGRITRDLLAAQVPDATTRRAFVSGPPSLVNDVRGILRSLGSRRVTTDYFSGY